VFLREVVYYYSRLHFLLSLSGISSAMLIAIVGERVLGAAEFPWDCMDFVISLRPFLSVL